MNYTFFFNWLFSKKNNRTELKGKKKRPELYPIRKSGPVWMENRPKSSMNKLCLTLCQFVRDFCFHYFAILKLAHILTTPIDFAQKSYLEGYNFH